MRIAWSLALVAVGTTAACSVTAAAAVNVPTAVRPTVAPWAVTRGALVGHRSVRPDSIAPPPLPFVRQVTICPSNGCTNPPGLLCTGDSILVNLSGSFPNNCYHLRRIDLVPSVRMSPGITPPTVRLVVDDGCCLGRPCGATEAPWGAHVKLPPLPAGFYPLTLQVAEVCCTDSVTDPGLSYQNYGFAVLDSCGPQPPGPLPYVDNIWVVGPPVCITVPCPPPCPGDSLHALIYGTFPNDCYRLRRIDVVPSIATVIGPPVLRLVVDNGCCLDRLCPPSPTPWHAEVRLPWLPPGSYDLITMLAEVCCTDSVSPGPLPTARTPFGVDTCSAPPVADCLLGRWEHPQAPDPCDAPIAVGLPAKVTFAINSTVALSGLQGEINLGFPAIPEDQRPGPAITRLEPIGAAAGMHLQWSASPLGAKFVMFSDAGAPIPAAPRSEQPPVPVLAVTAELQPGGQTPGEILVAAINLLGADAAGRGVSRCPVRLADDVARICRVQDCDFNRDGFTDVRDLVLMVRCLRSDTCAATSKFDCDRDGAFTLDDVLCCATRILGRVPCPDCPRDTSAVRKEPLVRLVVEPAITADDGAELPLHLDGAERVGAARLALRFPSDRYDVASVDAPNAGNDWLTLTQVNGDELVIGLIEIGAQESALQARSQTKRIDLTLHLRLRPGMPAGGDVATTGTEFSGPDGARLAIQLITAPQPLVPGLVFALSENRPDPFAGVTRFSVTLPREDVADLGVFDITGRRVATLHHGLLGSGPTEFAWNSRLTNGARAHSGIYFYRAAVGGRTLSRKMVLLESE